jgi:hypothetical protein
LTFGRLAGEIRPMARLSRIASGTRHARWAREVLASLNGHLAVNDLLSNVQKAALSAETVKVQGLVGNLDAAVVPYRAFIDGAHIEIRAKQRVADYLCDEAERQTDGAMRPYKADLQKAIPGGLARIFSGMPLSRVLAAGQKKTIKLAREAASVLQTLPPVIPGTAALAGRLETVADLFASFVKEREEQIEPQRRPLKIAVEKSVLTLREGLEQMDGRLRSNFSHAFIESLYPELTKQGTALADETDEEDDDTALPDEPAAPVADAGKPA